MRTPKVPWALPRNLVLAITGDNSSSEGQYCAALYMEFFSHWFPEIKRAVKEGRRQCHISVSRGLNEAFPDLSESAEEAIEEIRRRIALFFKDSGVTVKHLVPLHQANRLVAVNILLCWK